MCRQDMHCEPFNVLQEVEAAVPVTRTTLILNTELQKQ